MLLQMARFHSFLWLSSTPACIYTTSSLPFTNFILMIIEQECFVVNVVAIVVSVILNIKILIS